MRELVSPAGPPWRWQLADARNAAVILAVATIMLAFGWIGYLAGDDSQYAGAARAWLEHRDAGRGTAAMRPTVVLPIAASFALFGAGEIALVLPTLGYFLALLALTYAALSAACDRATGLAAALLLATTPLFAVTATVASVDMAEFFFVAASLWLFHGAERSARRRARLLGAGLAAGLAVATRETSVVLLGYYALLACLDERARRGSYGLIFGAAVAVGVGELAYFWALTGNPLHRLYTDFKKQQDFPPVPTGNIEFNRWVNPILALLLNQEFALLFFIAVPAALAVSFGRGVDERARRAVRLIGGLGALWFAGVGYCPWLRNLPRYFSVSTYAAVIGAAAWLRGCWARGRRGLAAAAALLLVAFDLLGVYVDNRDPLYGARRLAEVAAGAGEVVHTDPRTADIAAFLLAGSGSAERVSAAPPPAGALFLYDPKEASADGGSGPYAPRDGWVVVRRFDPGRKLSGRVVEWLGVDAILPAEIARKLDRPNPAVTVYRVSG